MQGGKSWGRPRVKNEVVGNIRESFVRRPSKATRCQCRTECVSINSVARVTQTSAIQAFQMVQALKTTNKLLRRALCGFSSNVQTRHVLIIHLVCDYLLPVRTRRGVWRVPWQLLSFCSDRMSLAVVMALPSIWELWIPAGASCIITAASTSVTLSLRTIVM